MGYTSHIATKITSGHRIWNETEEGEKIENSRRLMEKETRQNRSGTWSLALNLFRTQEEINVCLNPRN